MLFAITTGTLGGTVLAFFVCRWLLRTIANGCAPDPEQRKTIKVVGGVFGAIALAPAIFLAVMAGGTVGMRYAGLAADFLGLGTAAAALLLALQVILATTVTVTANAAVGAALGIVFARSVRRPA
jgi:hypothetical protein